MNLPNKIKRLTVCTAALVGLSLMPYSAHGNPLSPFSPDAQAVTGTYAGLEQTNGIIQINSQADFDAWVSACASNDAMSRMDVALNCDVTVTCTTGCAMENFYGTFNGNWHTMTMDLHYEGTATGVAFVRYCYGTIQNLNITGEIEGSVKYCGGVVQSLLKDGLLENINSDVTIISHVKGDGTHGGIAALCEGVATMRNIVFSGAIKCPEGNTDCCAGITGWNSAQCKYQNILMIADLSEVGDNDSNTIGRPQHQCICTNVFAIAQKNSSPEGCKIVSMEELATGAICFLLNGDQHNPVWFQTLGEDPMPLLGNLTETHKQVFVTGNRHCDGTIEGEATYNNEAGTAIPEHTYENGICTNCGALKPGLLNLVNGWYEISTPEQLTLISHFACENPSINIKLKNDIDMEGMDYTPITGPYTGVFDGQGHTISNLVVVKPESDMIALVGLAGAATIKNLTLDETCYFEGKGYCAGFVGETSGSVTLTLEGLFMHGNVKGTAANMAAIFACNMGSAATIKMSNCGMSGFVKGDKECGLLSGWLSGKAELKNVWAVGSVEGADNATDAVFCRPANTVALSNCWSVAGSRSGVGKLSEDAAISGELTWKLNGEKFLNTTWFQTLGEDKYPSLNSGKGIVYPTTDGYTSFVPNDPASFEKLKKNFFELAEVFFLSDDVVEMANKNLVAEYEAIINAYDDAADMDAFLEIYNAETAKKNEINTSITAYKKYEAEIALIAQELESRDDISGDDRRFLEEYLSENFDTDYDERTPNGSFAYIMDTRQLTANEVNKEVERARNLLSIAVANGYVAGTEVTNMLVNANFADGLNGWQGLLFSSGFQDQRGEGFTIGSCEYWGNAAKDMYQDITVSKGGIYELQMRGGYRPFHQAMAIQYYPYIYLNGNANYLQAIIEDYMPIEDAIEDVNVNLNPDRYPDLAITNDNGETIGYALHGVQSCNIAFSAGRYDNRILVYVNPGETLRVGCCHPYSGFGSSEWVGIGDIHLTYVGELNEAEEALNRVLASQMARANTLQKITTTSDADYIYYPNYSQALKDRLAAAMEMAAATDAEGKYAAIVELGETFKAIAECKRAYQSFFTKMEKVYSAAFSAYEIDPTAQAMANEAQRLFDIGLAAYEEGTMDAQEAAECALVKDMDVFPTIDVNGTYHVANTAQYLQLVAEMNANTTADNGKVYNVVLDGDVYMNNNSIVENFYGTFDGQFHTINVDLTGKANEIAAFHYLRGATVKNLTTRGLVITTYKYAAGLAVFAYEASGRGCTIEQVQSSVDIVSSVEGDGTHGGLLAETKTGTTTFNNCVFDGSMSGSNTNSCGGIIGWGNNTNIMNNCLVIANITVGDSGSNIFSRNKITATNCYYLTPFGGAPAGATQIDDTQLASGEVTRLLNNNNSRFDVAWHQTLGVDLVPTLDPTHKVVFKREDGSFSNEADTELEMHTGDADDPYVVNTTKDMAMLRRFLIPGRVNYIKLGADIDMTGVDNWEPLNLEHDRAHDNGYQNLIDFDGQGHIIRNFSCTDEAQRYNSFFGMLCGHVRNVGFENINVVSVASGGGALGAYIGHTEYLNPDYTRGESSLINVWVTGRLVTANEYTGGMFGTLQGPTTIRNCYSNLEIISSGTSNPVGGIIARVRDRLVMENVYAAGSIQCESPNVGGILAGGHRDMTGASTYSNVVVWNNTDHNFGPTLPEGQDAPVADLLDVQFNLDGTATDISPMANKVETFGKPVVETVEGMGLREPFNRVKIECDYGGYPANHYRVNYANNEAFIQALADGYTAELEFISDHTEMLNKEVKPFGATQSGGMAFLVGNDSRSHSISFMQHTKDDYRWADSKITPLPGVNYHCVAKWDKEAGKLSIYINGIQRAVTEAAGEINFPRDEFKWFCIGGDTGIGTAEASSNLRISAARLYTRALSDKEIYGLYLRQNGENAAAGDKLENISYYDGTNFAALQSVVIGWGKPWQCGMAEGEYPTFDGAQTAINKVQYTPAGRIFNLNGIEQNHAIKGIYIIDGRKELVK